mmetsp:Transcript_36468/g.113632  ORF Transcript_36468/g.113632 Transcript_36468/m.113632 type:complete len:537 (-) Transcript_36468:2807-4417(-)
MAIGSGGSLLLLRPLAQKVIPFYCNTDERCQSEMCIERVEHTASRACTSSASLCLVPGGGELDEELEAVRQHVRANDAGCKFCVVVCSMKVGRELLRGWSAAPLLLVVNQNFLTPEMMDLLPRLQFFDLYFDGDFEAPPILFLRRSLIEANQSEEVPLELLDLLAKHDKFKHVDISYLCQHLKHAWFPQEFVMCSEDEELTSNYIIAQGAVDYIVRNHDGVEMPQLCKRFTKGDVFGESALVNQRVRTGSIRVQVSRDSTGGADVLVYSREDLARAKAARKSQEILALFRQKQERSEEQEKKVMDYLDGLEEEDGFFCQLSSDVRRSLAGKLKLVELEKGQEICSAGEELKALLIRLRGSIVEVRSGDGERSEEQLRDHRGFLSSVRAFQGKESTWACSLRSSSRVCLLSLSRKDYLEVLKQHEDSRFSALLSFCREHVFGKSDLPEELRASNNLFLSSLSSPLSSSPSSLSLSLSPSVSLARLQQGSTFAVQDSTCEPLVPSEPLTRPAGSSRFRRGRRRVLVGDDVSTQLLTLL